MARYSDFKIDFDPHPHTHDLLSISVENAVKTSLRNIVYTDKYERFHNPKFGAGLPQKLFENFNKQTQYLIETGTEQAIRNYEPRVTNVQVHASISDDDNAITVYIVFTVINIAKPIELNVILRRVR